MIYGRFGYGVATRGRSVRLRNSGRGWRPTAPTGGTVRMLDSDGIVECLALLHERLALRRGRPDEPLELLLADPRDVTVTGVDETWLRLVDVPGALSARSYAAAEPVLIAVHDPFLERNAGVYRIADGTAERVGPLGGPLAPELECDAAALAMAYLGDRSPSELAATGWWTCHDPKALARAAAAFATDTVPWCGTSFSLCTRSPSSLVPLTRPLVTSTAPVGSETPRLTAGGRGGRRGGGPPQRRRPRRCRPRGRRRGALRRPRPSGEGRLPSGGRSDRRVTVVADGAERPRFDYRAGPHELGPNPPRRPGRGPDHEDQTRYPVRVGSGPGCGREGPRGGDHGRMVVGGDQRAAMCP